MTQTNSLRGQGLTYIPTDKPTRAKLKALAESEGLPLSHYLRELASRELNNKSIPLGLSSPGSGPVRLPKPLEGKIEGVLDSTSVMLWIFVYLMFGEDAFKPEVNKRVHEVKAAAGQEFMRSLRSNLTKLMPQGEQAGFDFGEESS